jgi:GNAT superfamily N-acetyltransferase
MAFDHGSTTEHVWQLDLRREPRDLQVIAAFREVRLPRPVTLAYPHDPRALADDWERKAITLVATSGTQPIGYAALSEQRSSGAWIADLVVVPRLRRHGVARALVAAAQRWAVEQGHRRLFVEMPSKNYPMIRLALQLGYEFCGYNDHYYSTQDIALFFVRAL